ncbi:MAG: DHH family phosphoesterase [Leptospiraceae bacterium]|nr:DHH family phosphoesterase [Leptospiraceae bacterium]
MAPTVNPDSAIKRPADLQKAIWQHTAYAALQTDPWVFTQSWGGFESPWWIPNMLPAALCLDEHARKGSPVHVLGDRDVDGVSSTALLGRFLRQLYAGNHYPEDRINLQVSDAGDDYGLSGAVFDSICKSAANLVILLDMGSTNGPEIKRLKQLNKDVIVLDHHQLHDRLPDDADCWLVNPNLPGPQDFDRNRLQPKIATAGLVFKLIMGYGLLHTSESGRLYHFQDGQNRRFFCYCGLTFNDPLRGQIPQSVQFFDGLLQQRKRSIDLVPLSDPRIRAKLELDDTNWEFLQRNPQMAASHLLGMAIARRTRFRQLIVNSAELAAIGLLADMVPVTNENRHIIRLGLKRLECSVEAAGQSFQTEGLAALIKKLGLPVGPLTSRDVGWSIAPCINAAGRMDQTRLALDLLICKDRAAAEKLAKQLIELNQARKSRTSRNEAIIKQLLHTKQDKLSESVLFCYHPDLEKGVSGIVATRLTEQYQKPAIYIHRENERYAKGSIRTWDGVHVLELINRCADLFVQHGGHPEAAGFSIPLDSIQLMEERLKGLGAASLPRIETSQSHSAIFQLGQGFDLLRLPDFLSSLEPFGAENPEPVFILDPVLMDRVQFMREGIHARFQLKEFSRAVDFVAWHKGPQVKEFWQTGQKLRLEGSVDRNYFAGRFKTRFQIATIQKSEC